MMEDIMNLHLQRAYAEGVRRALNDELTKESGLASSLGGIPRAVRGGLWGAGLGGAHGAFTGEGEEDILRGALTGGLIGTGVGYGSRHLSKGLRQLGRETPGKLWEAGKAEPGARELLMRQLGGSYEKLLKQPGERAALGRSLQSMGILGLGGGIAAGPMHKRMSRREQPAYDDLYRYYQQSAQRGMR